MSGIWSIGGRLRGKKGKRWSVKRNRYSHGCGCGKWTKHAHSSQPPKNKPLLTHLNNGFCVVLLRYHVIMAFRKMVSRLATQQASCGYPRCSWGVCPFSKNVSKMQPSYNTVLYQANHHCTKVNLRLSLRINSLPYILSQPAQAVQKPQCI